MSEYKPEYAREVVDVILSGKSLGAWRQKTGVTRRQFYNWQGALPEFMDAITGAWIKFRARVPFRPEYSSQVVDILRSGGGLAAWRRKIGVPKEEFRRWCADNGDFNEAVKNTFVAGSAKWHEIYRSEIAQLVNKGGNLATWRKSRNISIVEWRRWLVDVPGLNAAIKTALGEFNGQSCG